MTTAEHPARLGPNDRQPCGTHAARITHAAHGETCDVCWPDEDVSYWTGDDL